MPTAPFHSLREPRQLTLAVVSLSSTCTISYISFVQLNTSYNLQLKTFYNPFYAALSPYTSARQCRSIGVAISRIGYSDYIYFLKQWLKSVFSPCGQTN